MIELLCRRRVPWEREATENHFCEVNKTLVNGVTDEMSSLIFLFRCGYPHGFQSCSVWFPGKGIPLGKRDKKRDPFLVSPDSGCGEIMATFRLGTFSISELQAWTR